MVSGQCVGAWWYPWLQLLWESILAGHRVRRGPGHAVLSSPCPRYAWVTLETRQLGTGIPDQ